MGCWSRPGFWAAFCQLCDLPLLRSASLPANRDRDLLPPIWWQLPREYECLHVISMHRAGTLWSAHAPSHSRCSRVLLRGYHSPAVPTGKKNHHAVLLWPPLEFLPPIQGFALFCFSLGSSTTFSLGWMTLGSYAISKPHIPSCVLWTQFYLLVFMLMSLHHSSNSLSVSPQSPSWFLMWRRHVYIWLWHFPPPSSHPKYTELCYVLHLQFS